MKKILVIIIFLSTLSCKKSVDVLPVFDIPEDQAVKNVSDLEVIVNGAYQSLQSSNNYGAAYKLIPDIISDHITVNRYANEKGNTGGYLNVHLRQMYGTIDGVWRESYNCINRCNVVIDAYENSKVEAVNTADKLNLARIAGEAYLLRGMMHFELVRLYGLQYGIGSNADQSGVILKLKPTTDRPSQKRNTTEEVYVQVVKDLIIAIELLPERRRNEDFGTYQGLIGGRAIRVSAQAILARVYFQKATDDDDDAFMLLLNSMKDTGVDIGNLITKDKLKDSTGFVPYWSKFGYQVAESTLFQLVNLLNPVTNEANSTIKTLIDSYFYSGEQEDAAFPTIYQLNNNFDAFAKFSPGDLRKFIVGTVPIVTSSKTIVSFSQKYKINEGTIDLNVPIIRAGELVLSRAEVYATKGNLSAAIDDIIAIRNRNYVADGERANLVALSQTDLLLEIQRERSKELFTEGDRLHHFRRFAQRHQIESTKSMRSFTLSAYNSLIPNFRFDSKSSLFKIPDAEIAANPVVINN